MKALTVKQPWAYLIARGIKDIENRTWKTNFRGRVYIHAAAKSAGTLPYILTPDQTNFITCNVDPMPPDEMIYSAIIGEVDIIDCVINHTSIWAEKSQQQYRIYDNVTVPLDFKTTYNWVLANAVLYPEPILNVKGKLSFWEFEKPEG